MSFSAWEVSPLAAESESVGQWCALRSVFRSVRTRSARPRNLKHEHLSVLYKGGQMSGTRKAGSTDPTAAGWTAQNAFVPDPTTDGQHSGAVSLNAVTANGPGVPVDFGGGVKDVSIEVTTTGSPTGGTVTLMVSDDGVTYVATTTTVTVGANPAAAVLSNGAWRYVRTDLSSLTGGTAPTVTAKVMAA
jgi:hypothetical protein